MASASAPPRAEGRLERLSRERQERDFALAYPDGMPADPRKTRHPEGLWFDPDAAEHPITVIESLCCHHKGEWAGQPLLLEAWQKRILRAVFGWMRRDGTRRFRIAWIEVPRKNGKSELAAGVGLYLLVADGEAGAEVYSSATKKDQAKIVHDTAVAMVKRSPGLRRVVKSFRNNLHCPRLGSKFEPLGADSQTLDGLNPHGNIVDEVHAHRDRGVWDVLDTAMGARRQPLTWAITTAGTYEPESIGWVQHDHAVKVLEGTLEDDAFFAFIAAADPEDDPFAPETWAKANPNYGVSVKPEYLAAQAKKAEEQPSFRNTFLRLHLDQWTQQQARWLSVEKWKASDPRDLRPPAYREWMAGFRGELVYGGLDLAAKIDLAAFVLAVRDGDEVALLARFWCPAATITERSRRDRVPYDAWTRDGWLEATPGNVIDYDHIRAEVGALAGEYQVHEVGYDPWNATQLAVQLQGDGLPMVEVRQGPRTLSDPCKEFEKLIVAGKVRHGGHPILTWMVANVAARRDANDNIAPDKKGSGEKIDGVVASIMALSRLMAHGDPGSVYEERGLLIV